MAEIETGPAAVARQGAGEECDRSSSSQTSIIDASINKQAKSWRDVLSVHPAADLTVLARKAVRR